MPYVSVWMHIVFSTKNREPFLDKKIRFPVFQHIKQNAEAKGIRLDCINGYHDHVHLLVALSSTQTISDVVRLIKGESAHWINEQKLGGGGFKWQNDYFAVSVSQSAIETVRAYIYNQEEHHQTKDFAHEVRQFMERYDFGTPG